MRNNLKSLLCACSYDRTLFYDVICQRFIDDNIAEYVSCNIIKYIQWFCALRNNLFTLELVRHDIRKQKLYKGHRKMGFD